MAVPGPARFVRMAIVARDPQDRLDPRRGTDILRDRRIGAGDGNELDEEKDKGEGKQYAKHQFFHGSDSHSIYKSVF